jgi:cysteine desulfurase
MPASTPERIYLDHNATTPVFPEVVEAMRACWSEPYLNPASQHEFGRRARRILEDARDRIGELLGANTSGTNPDRVIFTSGGTESNNLGIRGIRSGSEKERQTRGDLRNHLIVSAIEHPSIGALADQFARIWGGINKGLRDVSKSFPRFVAGVSRLAVDENGIVSLIDLARCIGPTTNLTAVMLANNETGVIQPITDFAAICNQHEVPLHVDAAQAIGKLPLDFRQLGAGTMAVAAHKFGGPLGIGALVARDDVQLNAQFSGGVQQGGIRPGTESVALAVGLRTALELWHEHQTEWSSRIAQLRDEFEAALCREGALTTCRPVVIGASAPRLPTTSNIAFVGLDRQALFIALDQAGVACSTGAACASGSSEPSPVHLAMGLEPAVISSALRFSFGVQTTHAEVAESVDRILRICNNLRSQKQS